MRGIDPKTALLLLRLTPLGLLGVVVVVFSVMSPSFLSLSNFANILAQASHIGIMAVGITFVLLIAGIDLSIGAAMYVAAAIVGLYLAEVPVPVAIGAMALVAGLMGAINSFFIVKLRLAPFITTLAMLFIGRGLALYLSETRMVFASPGTLAFGQGSFLGLAYAVWLLLAVFAVAFVIERRTPFGRYLYAVGSAQDAARKAGLPVDRTIVMAYVFCSICAGIGGFVSMSQVAAASPNFGLEKEFPVIAAAVLGGTSLFGGRGSVLGSVFGAVLIQTVQNGLVLVNANPYVYPLVIASIILLAVLIDSLSTRALARLMRRKIRL